MHSKNSNIMMLVCDLSLVQPTIINSFSSQRKRSSPLISMMNLSKRPFTNINNHLMIHLILEYLMKAKTNLLSLLIMMLDTVMSKIQMAKLTLTMISIFPVSRQSASTKNISTFLLINKIKKLGFYLFQVN